MSHAPIRYSDNVEVFADDERETIDLIIKGLTYGGEVSARKEGRHVRTSHAKSHGHLKGEMEVLPDLPEPLAQGLFARPKSYPVLARLSHVPSEILDDRTVSTPKGFVFKVFGVEGEKLPGHALEATQDFLFNTGEVFTLSTPKQFIAMVAPVDAVAPRLPEPVKKVVSGTARALDAATRALGVESANLDFFGHKLAHPLTETYFGQVAFRYGDYIAKFRLSPISDGLLSLAREKFELEGENGLRTAVLRWFNDHSAVFELSVQLCTDLKSMPVEDPHARWSQTDSPFQPVARLSFPPQNTYSAARQEFVDEELSFCPSHSLAAHRPLGAISRARLAVYQVMADKRRHANGRPTREPSFLDEIPD